MNSSKSWLRACSGFKMNSILRNVEMVRVLPVQEVFLPALTNDTDFYDENEYELQDLPYPGAGSGSGWPDDEDTQSAEESQSYLMPEFTHVDLPSRVITLQVPKQNGRANKQLFGCDLCKEEFLTKRILLLHQRSVHEKKPSSRCKICKKCFATKKNLKIHKHRVHEKVNPLSCKTCGRYFFDNWALESHQLSFHKKKRRFRCQKCNRSFATKFNKEIHERRVHEEHNQKVEIELL